MCKHTFHGKRSRNERRIIGTSIINNDVNVWVNTAYLQEQQVAVYSMYDVNLFSCHKI
jgi:hypothetical protein